VQDWYIFGTPLLSLSVSNFRHWFPAPNAYPIRTFPKRLIRKWLYIANSIYVNIGSRLGFFGARIVGVAPNGNTLLQLNKNYPLGSKGTVIELPRDLVIFEYVKKLGFWELDESKFLAHGLKRACRNTHKVALLDIGANTGLVTLQAMNLSNTSAEVFLFEPVPRHASAIKKNLRNLLNINVNEFGLSDKNGQADIFTEATNYGNTSLLNSVVPEIGMISTQIQLVETKKYCNKFLNNFDRYIIKCDTQGMDALILSRIPEPIWKNCVSAVIEVWALDEISNQDVETLLSMLQEFEHVAWQFNTRKEKIELSEVSEFWLSKSGSHRNLFLSKNI
jgi:FkbM family methyltransferase